MKDFLDKTIVIFGFLSIPLIIILILLTIINKKYNTKVLHKISKIIVYILTICFALLILVLFCTSTFIGFYFIYVLLFITINSMFTKEVTTFLSLFGTLSLGVYFPDKIGYLFLRLLDFLTKNKRKLINIYTPFIKFLRLKLWIYLFAFLITLISSMEEISGNAIITNSFWISIRPYTIQAVVTFIAFDRFINLLKPQLTNIRKDIINIKEYIKK